MKWSRAWHINRLNRWTSRVITGDHMTRKDDKGDQSNDGETTWTNTGATRYGRGSTIQGNLETAWRGLRPPRGHNGCLMMMMVTSFSPVRIPCKLRGCAQKNRNKYSCELLKFGQFPGNHSSIKACIVGKIIKSRMKRAGYMVRMKDERFWKDLREKHKKVAENGEDHS